MFAYCKYHGIGIIPWGPLGGGRLARPLNAAETTRSRLAAATGWSHEEDADREIIKRVEEIAAKRGKKMSQISLAWASRQVTSPIVGVNSIGRVDESVVDFELTDEEAKYLEEP
ncbi:NADP-dependent oxidoreductase domain-containing protein [Schizophyllum fasciatum]